MSYEPPEMISPVIMDPGYTPPDLSEPVVLCTEDESGGTLLADLASPALAPPELDASLSQAYRGNLTADVPAAAPALSLEAIVNLTWSGTLSVDMPPATAALQAEVALKQNLELPDADGTGVTAGHHPKMPALSVGRLMQSQQADQIRLPRSLAQQQMVRTEQPLGTRSASMVKLRRPLQSGHLHGLPLQASGRCPHAEAIRTRASAREQYQQGLKRHGNTGVPHAETIKRRQSLRMQEQQALPAAKGLAIGNHNAWPTGTRLEVRWTKAAHPEPGYWWPEYQPPGLRIVLPLDPDYSPRPLRCPVILGPGYEPQPPCETDPEPPATIIVPVREVYRVINTLTLTELDGTPVPAESFAASIDADSWTWSWNARIPAYAIDQVRPDSSTRVELMATINGEPLRVLVESIQRERRFGESWLRVSGRGRAAFLAEPLAPVTQYTNDTAMTAQQALNETMTTNGVPIGWTLDWQIEDWQIPAGIWSHNGTWIDAAKRIAEAGGAYVQSHDTDQVLQILPRYPIAPWNWGDATPDIQLPEDVVEVEGIEWQEKPDYNAVWVHGGDQGRADRIIRGSSGGTNPAPTIVDDLATDAAMTRQRGLALLGDTGKQAQISLRLPVLPETGMIRPGTLVEYLEQGTTRRGLVRSLSISHSRPELWQTIGVETHE